MGDGCGLAFADGAGAYNGVQIGGALVDVKGGCSARLQANESVESVCSSCENWERTMGIRLLD